jgi:hypothetical protein
LKHSAVDLVRSKARLRQLAVQVVVLMPLLLDTHFLRAKVFQVLAEVSRIRVGGQAVVVAALQRLALHPML